MALTLHLSQFDGPLDMLLFLIGKAKVNIQDIFVSQVTDQYIQSVRNAPDLDMDDASAFIAMAATLVEIKSRSLLPKPRLEENEEDPEQALIRQLEEYKLIRQAAEEMQQFEKAAAQMFSKLPEEYPLPPPTLELTGLTLDGLVAAFARVLARAEEEGREENAFVPRPIIRDEHDVPGCIRRISVFLRRGSVRFEQLFSQNPTREEVVTLFLALLEMLRLGRAEASQEGVYGEIILSPRAKEEKDDAGERQPGEEDGSWT